MRNEDPNEDSWIGENHSSQNDLKKQKSIRFADVLGIKGEEKEKGFRRRSGFLV